MELIVSKDGYSVTGDKALRRFGVGVASLDKEGKNWIVLLDNKERIVEVLRNKVVTKPRISFLHDRVYIIVEGIDEEVHYYLDLDDFEKIKNQINNKKTVCFGVFDEDRKGIEEVIENDIII